MKTNSIISFACAITLMACSNGNKAVTTDGHNAENSLDYEGTYYGVLPIGVVTALVGGPFFIYLLCRRKREVGW